MPIVVTINTATLRTILPHIATIKPLIISTNPHKTQL